MENVDQTLVNTLHGQWNCEISGFDYSAITRKYVITHIPLSTHVTPIL